MKSIDFNQESRVPPQAIEVEYSVLGAMLLDRSAIDTVMEVLGGDESAFYKPAHQAIFRAMKNLYNVGEAIDLLTLTDALKKSGELEKVGGEYYLTELTTKVSTAANCEYHAHIILEKSILRQLIRYGSDIAQRGYSEETDALELLDEAGKQILEIIERKQSKKISTLSELLHKFNDWFTNLKIMHGVTGIPSGYIDLDKITCGFQNSDLIIIAGCTSSGKTALAVSISRNVAIQYGMSVGIFSLEMSNMQNIMRLLSAESKINSNVIRSKELYDNKVKDLQLAVQKLDKSNNIYIDDTAGLPVLEFRAKARQMKQRYGVKLIVVDYLQLMIGKEKSQTRDLEIGTITRTLKAVAKELDLPVIALSQINRESLNNSKDKRPRLSNLRESGNIENDADVVLFTHRPEMFGIATLDGEDTEGLAEIIIAKQRNGPTDSIKLSFIKQFVRFENRYLKPDEPIVQEEAF